MQVPLNKSQQRFFTSCVLQKTDTLLQKYSGEGLEAGFRCGSIRMNAYNNDLKSLFYSLRE